jgi:dsDNA-specific endonuclease/ATPase MutS2
MTFLPGARVHLAGLGTGTIREVRSGGRYAVEIKGRLVIAAAGDLELADPPSRRREQTRERALRTRPHPPAPPRTRAHPPAPSRTRSLDLHGKTAAEARDALDAFVNDALLENCAQVRVIHGRGGGRLKAAVHHYLRGLPAIASFRLDPQNPGVTIVSFA